MKTQNYINGEYQNPEDPVSEKKHYSPGNQSQLLETWKFGFKDIDRALNAAVAAQRAWAELPRLSRTEKLLRVVEFVQSRSEEWRGLLSSHAGLSEFDATEEVQRALDALRLQLSGETLKLLNERFKDTWSFNALGTVAIIGSFSESLVYGLQESVRYLISGNTVVFKPSEKLFITGSLLAQAFHFAKMPPGTWNMIYGDREVGRRLAVHEGVDSISFFGGYESAIRIKQDTLQQSWKRLSLWMCGKSISIVDEKADLSLAVKATLQGAFSYSGQCCDSTSRVLVHERLQSEFIDKIHQASKLIKIGVPGAQMGALIDEGAVDRYIKFQGIAAREGAEIIMRGKALDTEMKGNFVSPSIAVMKNNDFETNKRSVYLQTEILGPNIAVQFYKSDEEAISLANNNPFPVAVAVFTQKVESFDSLSRYLKYSRVILNQSTRAPAYSYPQTAIKKSGNQSLGGALGFLDAGNVRAIIK